MPTTHDELSSRGSSRGLVLLLLMVAVGMMMVVPLAGPWASVLGLMRLIVLCVMQVEASVMAKIRSILH